MLDSLNFDHTNIDNCLTDLNLNDLLKLKHSIEYVPKQKERNFNIGNTCVQNNDNDCMKPEALPLMAETREYISSSGYDYSSNKFVEEKPSRVQAIFYVSITALTFLAFGGYLLCLIVQAIKNKGQLMYMKPVGSTVAPTRTTGIKGIKVYKRSRRSSTTTTSVPLLYTSNDPISLMDPYQYYTRNKYNTIKRIITK